MKRHRKNRFTFNFLVILLTLGGSFNFTHAQELSENNPCIFTIGESSSLTGTYVVNADEEGAFAYNDFENEQYVIEIHGFNNISIMLIIESLTEGKHNFSMEMQVSIDISKDGGNNYVSFSNYKEEGGGFIEINEIDKENERLLGSFEGIFHEDMAPADKTVKISGTFKVNLEE